MPDTPTDGITPLERRRRERPPGGGYTVQDLAERFRVSPEKVRGWIRRGELRAVNTADTARDKPRLVVPDDAVAEFERGRSAAQPKPAPRRRRRPAVIDFYPD